MRLQFFILLSALSLATAAEPPVIREAQQALADGLPEIATAKLSRALSQKDGLPEEYIPAAKLQLLEAYVRAGHPDDALALKHEPTPDTAFWTALAQTRINYLTRALKTLSTIPEDHPRARAAAFVRADILLALDNQEGALEALAPYLPAPDATTRTAEILLNSGDPEKASTLLASLETPTPQSSYLAARIALEAQDPGAALAAIGATPSADAPPQLSGHLAIARARALQGMAEPTAAREIILNFVRTTPANPLAATALAALEPFGAYRDPAIIPALDSILENSPPPDLARAARVYKALTLSNTAATPEETAAAYAVTKNLFVEPDEITKGDPEYERAVLLLIDLKNRSGIPTEESEVTKLEESTPESIRQQLADLEARALFKAGKFPQAAESFLASGETGTYNAAISSLRDGIPLSESTTDPSLLLERGLYAAANGDPDAAADLEAFLLAFPDDQNAYRAHLALAELASLTFPPKPRSAATHLAAAREAAPAGNTDALQRIDYTAIWVASAGDDPAAFTTQAKAFLARWPTSPLRPQVRMKLGETAFRAGNFPAARVDFETLAEESPDAPEAEAALFFAARAALSMSPGGQDSIDEAIALWEKVAARKGDLFFYAREQQALAKRSANLEADAIQILESILAADPPPPADLRASALLTLGEARLALAGSNPSQRKAAIDTFDALAADATISARWREDARYHKARALEAAGDTAAALEHYYDIVRTPIDTESTATPWRYRAGFEAIRLLEHTENWKGAITLAEELATTNAPRAAEAEALAERLKLQHFVYDEKSEL